MTTTWHHLDAPVLLEDRRTEDIRALARYRAVAVDQPFSSTEQERLFLIGALRSLPEPKGHRTKFAGKRIVRGVEWRAGGNPRQRGGHGYNAFELIPLDEFGIRAEDLLARITLLPAKSSENYGAGGANHLQWDLDRGFTNLIEDPGPPHAHSAVDQSTASTGGGFAVDLYIDPSHRVQVQTSRIVRDTEIVRCLKTLYSNSCQICGKPMRAESGWTYSEGHHIRPLGKPHDGPDISPNILILCPNHHAMCDYGQIRLNFDEIVICEGHPLGREFLEYHNRNILR